MLDLDQAFAQRGHGKHRQLVARVDGQHGQQPPAASRTVGCRLEERRKGKSLTRNTISLTQNNGQTMACWRLFFVVAGPPTKSKGFKGSQNKQM